MNMVVVDRNRDRANAFAALVRRSCEEVEVYVRTKKDSGEWETTPVPVGCDLVLRHYRDADQLPDAMAAGGVVVWYGGGGAEANAERVHNINAILTGAQTVNALPGEWLRELVDWARLEANNRARRPLPHLLKRPAPDDLLEPLLALGVLLDGYLAMIERGPASATEWFLPAMDAARVAQPPQSQSVDSPDYWEKLSQCDTAIERLGKVLADVSGLTPALHRVLESARRRAGSEDRAEIYRWACGAVRRAWEYLAAAGPTGSGPSEVLRGDGLGTLVEEASDGFHVLAAGHL